MKKISISQMTEASEEHILQLMGDKATRDEGFSLLMDTYKERIYWHIRRLVISHEDAEDILQETFINAYRYVGSFNGRSQIYTWLYRIATNECVRVLKHQKKTKLKNQELTERLTGEASTPDPVNGEEILKKFQQAIHQLPERQRIVFNLRYYDELEYEEIGKILNSSVNALKTNYHYASEKVKDYMINH